MQSDELMLRTQQIQAMRRPLPRDQNSVNSFIFNEDSMMGHEGHWIRRSDDLASISEGAEHTWLNGFVEDCLRNFSQRLLLVSEVSLITL